MRVEGWDLLAGETGDGFRGGEDEQGATEAADSRWRAGLPGGLTQPLGSCWRWGRTQELEPRGEVEAGGMSLSRKKVVRPETPWVARDGGGVERAES